jgi:RNA polymerase sigma-70 factor (ECF subfamily)
MNRRLVGKSGDCFSTPTSNLFGCNMFEIFGKDPAYQLMERRKTTGDMSAAELADVLTQVRAGDAEAWGQLYGQYAPAIFRFCRRALPTREDAEDATTEVFMKVRQKLGTYDASRPFTAWLYKVASNHCWDLLRRRRIRQDLETGDLETLPLEHPDPDQLEQLQTEHDSKHVRAGLAKMPDRARMALVLRYYSDMSYDEIADTLGVRRAFVGVLLLRARHQLREILAEGGGGMRTAAAGGKP